MTYDEKKFKNFNKLLRDRAKKEIDVLMVSHPETLGDDYEELVENLNRLSDSRLKLVIVPRSQRR
jgi:hypothetical protein